MPNPSQLSGGSQPELFQLGESIGNVELFPAVWSAAESLCKPDFSDRQKGLDRLLELNASRFSPLVAYLIATRLTDNEVEFRVRIVRALGDLLFPDKDGNPTPVDVRQVVSSYLSQMRTRQVYALLQALVEEPALAEHVARLLDACPYAGNHLADIVSDRTIEQPIREQAALAIGRVGFLDVLPVLERLETRLESRINGQRSMPFMPLSSEEEAELLPAVQRAIAALRAP